MISAASALVGTVADHFEHEPVWVEEVGREVDPVLGEVARLVHDDGAAVVRPVVRVADDRSNRYVP